jgi:hypothetical protein
MPDQAITSSASLPIDNPEVESLTKTKDTATTDFCQIENQLGTA